MEQVTIGVGALLTLMLTVQLWIINGLRSEIKGIRTDMALLIPRTECVKTHSGTDKDLARLEKDFNGLGGRVDDCNVRIVKLEATQDKA
jgi:hypothetical protein